MEKLMEMAKDLGKTILPALGEVVKVGAETALKLAGKVGGYAATFVKDKAGTRAKNLLAENQTILLTVALVSACIALLSFVGLVFGRKK